MKIKKAFNPHTIREALEILEEHMKQKVKIIAGGTDVMVFLHEKKLDVDYLLDISEIKDLDHVREDENHLIIGPLLTHKGIMENQLIKKYAPILIEGSAKVGSPQIRNRATIGGNVCTGSPAGDTLPPIAVHNARFTLTSKTEERSVEFKDFFTGPQKTIIKPNELLTKITIDKCFSDEKFFFHFLGMRKALSVTKVSMAARCKILDGAVEKLCIALGSVAPVVLRAKETENELIGRKIETETIEQAVKRIRNEVSPIDDIRSTGSYRKYIVGVLMKRFLDRVKK